jgi:hypothetical protein
MPKRKPNHIHINGRHYDADTGELIGGQPHRPAPPTPVIVHHAKPVHHGVHHTPKPDATPRHTVNHAHAHAPEPAHTLMRHAVKKPGREPWLRAQGHIARAGLTVAPKPSAQHLDELRARHAKHIRRSQLISHFSAGATYPVPTSVHHPQPVHSRPAAPARPVHHTPKPGLHHRRKPQTTADLLQKALEQATSFRELPVK